MENIDYNNIVERLITKHTSDIIKSIGKTTKAMFADISIQTQTAFISYIHQCIERFSNVKTLISSTTPTPLYDIYVHSNLSLSEYGSPPTYFTSNNINDLFDISSKIMILGSGGTGKSTLFKHLFLNTIKETDKIPIFITLREINNTDFNLMDFIYKSMNTFHFTLNKEYLFKSFSTGIYVFFFDGLDEVEENKKEYLIREINDFSTKYNNNHFLVSSRVSDSFSGGWDGYTDLEICRFNLEQAFELINKLDFDIEVKNKFMDNLETMYKYHPSFCSNPLLLTLMLMTFNEYAEIPTKIYSFYNYAYDVLYSKHDASKTAFKRKKKTDKNHLTYSSFKKILEAFSTISYLNNEISFKKNKLIDNINKAKRIESINLEKLQTEFSEDDYKDDLIEAVCIMHIEGLEYTYIHRSFQEFFTANYINRQGSESQSKLLERIVDTKKSSILTDQVLPMLLDMNKLMVERQLILPFLNSLKEDIGSLSPAEYFDLNEENMNSVYSLYLQVDITNQISIHPTYNINRHYTATASYTQILLLFIQLFYSNENSPIKEIVDEFISQISPSTETLFITNDLAEFALEFDRMGLSSHANTSGNFFVSSNYNHNLVNTDMRYSAKGTLITIQRDIVNKDYLREAIKPYKDMFISSFDYSMELLKKMSLDHEKQRLLEDDII